MKKPDEDILIDQNEMRSELIKLEIEKNEIIERIRNTRKGLDESIKQNGDMNVVLAGWNRNIEFQREQEKIRLELENDPVKMKEHQAFVEKLKENNKKKLELGVKQGWWEGIDEKGNPVPFPVKMNVSDFLTTDTMAHILFKAGIFESVSEGRKNGWNKPVERGMFTFKKKNKRVLIV